MNTMKIKKSILLLGVAAFVSCNSGTSTSAASMGAGPIEITKSPEELKAELKFQEQSSPAEYLTADGTYRENFWGDKLKIKCSIHSNATLATFKDVIVRVTYYTKTGTELGTKDYTIYEIVKPGTTKTVDMKIDNYKDVASIGWDVVSAVAMN